MSRLLVQSFSISIDGYGAGPNQDLANPLGVGFNDVHKWLLTTRTFKKVHGQEGGATGNDDDFAARGFADVGAWIMGRNMFGPVRGPWPDDKWKGWWGDDPVYHCPVFVLTHHARPALVMKGGTTFHFVTEGIQAGARSGARGRQGEGRAVGGWCRHHSGVSARWAHRRDAPGHRPGHRRVRGAAVWRD